MKRRLHCVIRANISNEVIAKHHFSEDYINLVNNYISTPKEEQIAYYRTNLFPKMNMILKKKNRGKN
jgi:hypothetical protein